jgi:hypothetical protein
MIREMGTCGGSAYKMLNLLKCRTSIKVHFNESK